MDVVLQCEGLRKLFGDRVAVDGVGFTIVAGETYGLLGPNGAGKTTTISMVCGLLRRDAGRVTLQGKELDTSTIEVKAAVGFVPQEIAIYPDLTARENLRFFGKLYGLAGHELDGWIDRIRRGTGADPVHLPHVAVGLGDADRDAADGHNATDVGLPHPPRCARSSSARRWGATRSRSSRAC